MKQTAFLFFIFFTFCNVKINKAQLLNSYKYFETHPQSIICGIAGTWPKPKKTFEELNSGFIKAIYPDTLTHRIFVKIYVDTLGIVSSANLFKSSGNKRIDSLTTLYVKSLKFIPAFYTRSKKKAGMFLTLPFPVKIKSKVN